MNSMANVCIMILASRDKLSSRVISSSLKPFLAVWRLVMSIILPESRVMACWRCKTKARVGTGGASESASFPVSVAPTGRGFLLGFILTAMVVPKREWREVALRACSLRFRSSVARSRCRFSVGCCPDHFYSFSV